MQEQKFNSGNKYLPQKYFYSTVIQIFGVFDYKQQISNEAVPIFCLTNWGVFTKQSANSPNRPDLQKAYRSSKSAFLPQMFFDT